jgi:hypothetical protein
MRGTEGYQSSAVVEASRPLEVNEDDKETT